MDLSKLSEKDLELVASGRMNEVSEEGLKMLAGDEPKERGLGAAALDYGTRALDYAAGLGRTAAANVLELGTDENVVSGEDVLAALRGQATPSSEFLGRAGVEQGGSLSDVLPSMYSESGQGWLTLQKGGALDPTARGAAGFVLDTALDPLTYLTVGAAPAFKAGGKLAQAAKTVASPLEAAARSGGRSMYKSGLKRIDQEAAKFGKEPVSDVLINRGIAGGAESIYRQMDELAEQLANQRTSIFTRADIEGGAASMQAAMGKAEALLQDLRASRDPIKQAAADKLEAEILEYRKLDPSLVEVPTGQTKIVQAGPVQSPETGFVTADYISRPITADFTPVEAVDVMKQVMTPPIRPSQATGMKTSLYDTLPKGTFQETVAAAQGVSPDLTRGRKAMAAGLNEEAAAAVERVLPGEGERIKQINDELSRLLTTKDKQQMEAFKEANKNIITSVDAPMLALAAEGKISPLVIAAKKAADIAKMTGPRTLLGRELYNLGTRNRSMYQLLAPGMDLTARRALINAAQSEE